MNGSKILPFREPPWRRFPWSIFLWKISLINIFVKSFPDQIFFGKFPYLYKISLIIFFVENFFDLIFCGKLSWSNILWKYSLTVENFLDYGEIPWSQKFFLTVGNLIYCLEKITDLTILEPLTHILNLKPKLRSLTFFVTDEINIISSRITNIKPLMRDNKKFIHT